jgi:transcriptional regulator with XRE-family HTH domain
MERRAVVHAQDRIGDRIKEARHRHGFSQREIAAACDVAIAQVSHWESHNRVPTIQDVLKIAELLGINPSELLANVENFVARMPDDATAALVQVFAAMQPFYRKKFLEFADHFVRMSAEAEPEQKPMVPQPERTG